MQVVLAVNLMITEAHCLESDGEYTSTAMTQLFENCMNRTKVLTPVASASEDPPNCSQECVAAKTKNKMSRSYSQSDVPLLKRRGGAHQLDEDRDMRFQ